MISPPPAHEPVVYITPELIEKYEREFPVDYGPLGEQIFLRTYAREKPDGTKERFHEAMARVVNGNLNYVAPHFVSQEEAEELYELLLTHQIVPGGRHIWATGVEMGNTAINNCHASDHTDRFSEHYEHMFMRLMEGGGVGSNCSDRFVNSRGSTPTKPGKPWKIAAEHQIHFICNPEHKDYERCVQLEHEHEEINQYLDGKTYFVNQRGDRGTERESFNDRLCVPFYELLSDEYSYTSTPSQANNVVHLQVEDSREGWVEALVRILDAYVGEKTPTTFVIDVSRLRPYGAIIRTFGGTASGPEAFVLLIKRIETMFRNRKGTEVTWKDTVNIEHWIAMAVVSGGARRSARMLKKYWGDPGIFDFINLKAPLSTGHIGHWTTNISVVLDNKFFRKLKAGDEHANLVADYLTLGILQNGEPGVVNASNMLKGEPMGSIFYCSNPCGEISFIRQTDLFSFDVCCLGHVNVAQIQDPARVFPILTRFLIRATCAPVKDHRMEANIHRNRRIGVGLLGVADWLVLNGIPYADAVNNADVRAKVAEWRQIVDEEARQYAHDLRIVTPVKTTTIAPTGTVSMISGTTSGLQPVFAKYLIRRVRMSNSTDAKQLEELKAKGHKIEPCMYSSNTSVVEFVTKSSLLERAMQNLRRENPEMTDEEAELVVGTVFSDEQDLDFSDVLAVQRMFQDVWANNAISVTANIRHGLSFEDMFDLVGYVESKGKRNKACKGVDVFHEVRKKVLYYGERLKGLTLFPEASMAQSPLERLTKEEFDALAETYPVDVSQEEQICKGGVCPIK